MPFAVDGITIVTCNDSPLTTNFTNNTVPVGFLEQLYGCTLPPGVQSQFRPLIPQLGSGTRVFFLRAIGSTETLLNLAVAEGGTCINGFGLLASGDSLLPAGNTGCGDTRNKIDGIVITGRPSP